MTSHLLFRSVLEFQASPAGERWLEQAREAARSADLAPLLAAYTSASRALGRTPLSTRQIPGEVGSYPPSALDNWTLEDAGRLWCLLERHAIGGGGEGFAADATACYEHGDAREQASWLRGAALLPDAAQFVPVVIDACRTNILTVFEAVACENPYPATHFPELHFNQLVLKALFNGVALTRIIGLEVRANATLARMASDYADERRAAGRSVPADLPLATIADTRTLS